MDNWIDLSEIPKIKHKNTFAHNWMESIGCICKFQFEGIKGEFKIVNYDHKKHILSVLYNDKEKKIATNYFKECKLKKIIGLISKDFKIEIGTTFIDNNRNIRITGRYYQKDKNGIVRKFYKYHCNKCDWTDGKMLEEHLLNGIGCSCCRKFTIVPFKNDLYTTNPELIHYFKNIEDTHKTTTRNKKEFMMICPNCGNEQLYSTDKLINWGFSCKKCGDGFSYGEKFIYSLLKQFNIEFITQLSKTTFKWCKTYKYDFYLPTTNTIIEVHGIQHYYDKEKASMFGYCKDNDLAKEKLAKKNGIENYIVIDCRKSLLSHIKYSIINSGLLEIIHKNDDEINWQECDKFTSKSYISLVCEYKNNHPESSTTDIGKIFHIARTTVQVYLQKGSNLGICIYDKEFERRFKTKKAKLEYYNNILHKE